MATGKASENGVNKNYLPVCRETGRDVKQKERRREQDENKRAMGRGGRGSGGERQTRPD